MKDIISIYNKKRSLFANDKLTQISNTLFSKIAIVIPVYNEFPGIFNTFNSLSNSVYNAELHFKNTKQTIRDRVTVVVVINNPIEASKEALENNEILYRLLTQEHTDQTEPVLKNSLDFPFYLHVCYLKNDKRVKSISKKKIGVGYARRYGMDLSLAYGASVIACMDADTLVSNNYIETLFDFEKNKFGFGICKFEHQKVPEDIRDSQKKQKAIIAYEKYIKAHSECLKNTGTPYWAYALGPTIVCNAESYASVGGMPIRKAGEDFYFIQSLEKLFLQRGNPKLQILDCTVYPSARLSTRVPFGTGQVLAGASDVKSIPSVYAEKTYEAIHTFLSVMRETIKSGCFEIQWKLLPKNVIDFLKKEDFEVVWHKLVHENKNNPKNLEIAFHVWFDGLKIIRLMHFLEKDTSQIFDI
ncbi:MAG: hypothetical protein BKP49_08555 [Treponema sp. CETP13]|nr:MAG: hypothetical protein BKP49_08555 [Treponema sp. CETP13]